MSAAAMVQHDLRCPECSAPMVLRTGSHGPFYGCSTWTATQCKGTHGAHPDGKPLGIPADVATKAARIEAHEAFDRLWQGGGALSSRKAAYRWLQETLKLSKADAHIGRFTRAQCDQVVAAVEAFEDERSTRRRRRR